MNAIIKVNQQGNLTIPKSILRSQGFLSEHEFGMIPVEDGFILKISPNADEQNTLSDFDTKIQSQIGNLTDRSPIFGALTADEYLSLSEEDRNKLWDLAWEESYQNLKDTEEIEVGDDYCTVGQRRDPESIRTTG